MYLEIKLMDFLIKTLMGSILQGILLPPGQQKLAIFTIDGLVLGPTVSCKVY